jgi:ABC-type polysaccharide/polyol phosphate transport system ATPase subunit
MARGRVILDGVWKKFRRGERHDSLRDLIPATARALLGRQSKNAELEEQEFWALRDVSFEVNPGDAIGLIGPNGAGKSTTLKMLTRILRPTKGHIEVRGRVGALIEIAAGFHPDLTGRENVFLQGSIMGMRQAEIGRKFDEIVEFAGVSEFIDTPVKRYSSGMNARLGFAIAAHLEPDVLFIDEVLAVGDFRFQSRAFAKVAELVRREIPVVVVSHQLDQIARLCTAAVLFERGRVAFAGRTVEALAHYASSGRVAAAGEDTAPIVVSTLRVSPDGPYEKGQTIRVTMTGRTNPGWIPEAQLVGLRLRAETGQFLFATGSDRLDMDLKPESEFTVEIMLTLNLGGGSYLLDGFGLDSVAHQEISSGPVQYLHVNQDKASVGSVFLEPRVEHRSGRIERGTDVNVRALAEYETTP